MRTASRPAAQRRERLAFRLRRALADSPGALASLLPRGAKGVRMVTLLAVLFWVASVSFVSVVRWGGDFRALLCLGDRPHHPPALEGIPSAGPAGYDGQQYAALATDPLLRDPDTALALDSPAYRATRLLVPLTSWVLALGRPDLAVIAYQLLCWALGIAGVALVARWLAAEGHSPWWALPLAGGAGLVASVFRSTPDAAAVFLVLLALWLHAEERTALALAVAVAAALTRETSYVAAIAIAVDLIRRRRLATAGLFLALPPALIGAWQVHLRAALGDLYFVNRGSFTVPFAWLGEKLPVLVRDVGIQWQEVYGLAAVVVTTVALVIVLARPSAWAPPELTFLAFGALGLILTWDVYIETWGYARILVALPFLATVIAERQRAALARWTLRAIPLLYMLAGLVMLRWEVATAVAGRGVLAAVREVAAGRTPGSGAEAGARPAGVTPLYAMPIANALGRSDAVWRTRLVVTNMTARENAVLVGLVPAGGPPSPPLHRWVTLPARESREWRNVAGELFGFSGAAALCFFPGGPIAAGFVTGDARLGPASAQPLPAVDATHAVPPGEPATLRGLAFEPAAEAAVRTNIGFLNVSRVPLQVRIEAFDGAGRRLGALDESVRPRGFLQIDDVFRVIGSGPVSGGSAVVRALSPAPFLAYASVIRGPLAPVAYVLPERSGTTQ